MQVMDKKHIALSVGWSVILVVMVLLQSLPVSPVYKLLEADSGVYAYVGSSILDGQLPYRDVWEHKPPIGFYLNALALLAFGHTPWAIWWFNVLWVSLTCITFFLLIKKMMGLLTGCLASLLFSVAVMQPELFQGGNLMEVYGLLFQVLIIGATYYIFHIISEPLDLYCGRALRIGIPDQADHHRARCSHPFLRLLLFRCFGENSNRQRCVHYFLHAGFLRRSSLRLVIGSERCRL